MFYKFKLFYKNRLSVCFCGNMCLFFMVFLAVFDHKSPSNPVEGAEQSSKILFSKISEIRLF